AGLSRSQARRSCTRSRFIRTLRRCCLRFRFPIRSRSASESFCRATCRRRSIRRQGVAFARAARSRLRSVRTSIRSCAKFHRDTKWLAFACRVGPKQKGHESAGKEQVRKKRISHEEKNKSGRGA